MPTVVDHTDLDVVLGAGEYLLTNPSGLSAGEYLVTVKSGADASGVTYVYQEATNLGTGVVSTRFKGATTFSDWTEVGAGGAGGGNTELDATLQLYVNGATGDDGDDGLTALTPKATIQAAFNLAATYDVNPLGAIHGAGGQFIQINVEAGTYDEQVTVPRFKNRMSIDLVGTGAGDVVINPTAQTYAVLVEHSNCQLSFDSAFDFRNAANYGIGIFGPTSRVLTTGSKFTSVGTADVVMEDGYYIEAGATLTGNPAAHIFAQKTAYVELSGALTLVGTPSWASAFINGSGGSVVRATYSPITGASAGKQFVLSDTTLTIFGGEAYANGLVGGLPGSLIGTWGTSDVLEPYTMEARTFTTGAAPITLSPGAYEIRYRLVSGGTAGAEVFALGSGQWMGQRVTVEFLTRTNAADRPQLDDTNIKFSSSNPAAGAAVDFGPTFNTYQLVDAGDAVAFEWGGDGWYMVFADPLPVLT